MLVDLIDVKKCDRSGLIFGVGLDVDAVTSRQKVNTSLNVLNDHAAADVLPGRLRPHLAKQEYNARLLQMILECIEPEQTKDTFTVDIDERQTRCIDAHIGCQICVTLPTGSFTYFHNFHVIRSIFCNRGNDIILPTCY